MSDKSPWQKLSSRIVYENPWIKVREDKILDHNTKEGLYGVVEGHGAVFVIAEEKDGSIYLIRQYRYPVDDMVYTVPSGIIEEEVSLEENALRELEEETGIQAGRLEPIGEFYQSPGVFRSKAYVFKASELDTSHLETLDRDEDILEIKKVSRNELKEMIGKSEIRNGAALAAITIYLNR